MLIPGQEEVRPWALGLGLSVPCSGEEGSQGPVGASASQSHQAKEAKLRQQRFGSANHLLCLKIFS